MAGTSTVFLVSVWTINAHTFEDKFAESFPINPALGISGFPDCIRKHPNLKLDVPNATQDLQCNQVHRSTASIKIGCVGDSITAGVCASNSTTAYPGQLQILLDATVTYLPLRCCVDIRWTTGTYSTANS